MKTSKILRRLFILLVSLSLASCGNVDPKGGNSSTGGWTDYAGGGIGGTGISVGKITDFGSVFVNGIEYDTTGAEIWIEGSKGGVSSGKDDALWLSRGMIVTVQWERSADGTLVARRIDFKDNLEGPVEGTDPANLTLTVLGQRVIVDNTTIFYDFSDIDSNGIIDIGDITSGDYVEISGLTDAEGNIHATYIKLKGGNNIEIKGKITNLQLSNGIGSFKIGGLTIRIDVNTKIEGTDINSLEDGLFVEVKGSSPPALGVLSATSVELEEEVPGFHEGKMEGVEVEIEGFVTDIIDQYKFLLNGHPVLIDSNTRFEKGTSNDIKVNVRIEVKGILDKDGNLVAEKIEFKSQGSDQGNNHDGDHRDD